MPMYRASSKYDSPRYHISRWHLIEHISNIFHLPALCILVNQITPHKDIWLQTTLNDHFMSPLAFSSATMLAHTFNTLTKVIEFRCTCSYCRCLNSSKAFFPCPHFTCPNVISIQVTTFRDAFCWKFSKCPLCSQALHTCQPSYSPQKHQIHNLFQWSYHEQSYLLQGQLQ